MKQLSTIIYILYAAVYIELKVKTYKLCKCLVDGHKNGPKHVVVNTKEYTVCLSVVLVGMYEAI